MEEMQETQLISMSPPPAPAFLEFLTLLSCSSATRIAISAMCV
uniref:Uncharacterized protein n=1 Tax=Rhizophora mucronata TaxID=61149 RepID=A0A2P2IH37_RHIMU